MTGESQFSISWRSIALASLLVNLGAIATITIIAAVQDRGVLNMVVLTLAMIIFLSQLVIYSIRTGQSGQQLQEA